MRWVRCQTCHGNGEIHKEVEPGKWERLVCPAGCTSGKVNVGTI